MWHWRYIEHLFYIEIIFRTIVFLFVSHQINAPLVSMKDFFQKHLNSGVRTQLVSHNGHVLYI